MILHCSHFSAASLVSSRIHSFSVSLSTSVLLCEKRSVHAGVFENNKYFFLNKRKTKEDLERGCSKDCQALKLKNEDAIDHSRWKKLIKDV